jgi:hypothetical protein
MKGRGAPGTEQDFEMIEKYLIRERAAPCSRRYFCASNRPQGGTLPIIDVTVTTRYQPVAGEFGGA